MAAPIFFRRGMKSVFHALGSYSRICHRCLNKVRVTFRSHLGNGSLTLVAALCHSNVNEKLTASTSDVNLTHAGLVKNASSAVVDASSTVLTQVVNSIVQTEREYKEAVESLSELLEFLLEIVGNGGAQEEKLWEDIVAARHKLNTLRNTQQELGILYSSVEKLMDASGEVAFFAGADYAMTCTGERLHSAKLYIDQVKAESHRAEVELNRLEVKVIEVTAKKAEEEEERKKREESNQTKTADSVMSDNTVSEKLERDRSSG